MRCSWGRCLPVLGSLFQHVRRKRRSTKAGRPPSAPTGSPGETSQPSDNAIDANAAANKAEPQATTSHEVESISETTLDADDGARDQESGPLACESVVTTVGRNHGHILTVSTADVAASEKRVYQIRGSSSHDHSLTVTPEEFALIASGASLRKRCDFGAGHRHRVLVRCQPAVLPPELVSSCEVIVAGEDGHELVIPESHVVEAKPQTYDVQGVAGHTHQLALSSDDFHRLRAGDTLDLKTTQGLGHFHHVYIRYLG